MAQKMLLPTSQSARTPFPTVKAEHIQAEPKAIYVDTCYLLQVVKSGLSLTESIRRLAQESTVIVVAPVLEELERNLEKAEFRQYKGRVLAEISALKGIAQSSTQILIENVSADEGLMESLSKHMYGGSTKRNWRVGRGEAAIFASILSVKELFGHITIYSSDSDVNVLAQQFPYVRVQ